MSLYWLVFLIITLIFAYRGYRKGIVSVVFKLISITIAYAGALLFTENLGQWIGSSTFIQGILAYMTAGVVIFMGIGLIVELLLKLLDKLLLPQDLKTNAFAKVSGGIAGSLIGAVLGLIVVWGVSFLAQTLPNRSVAPTIANESPIFDIETGLIETTAHSLFGMLAKTALTATTDDPAIAKLMVQLVEQPNQTMIKAQRFSQLPELRELFSSKKNQDILNTADINRIKKIPAFKALIGNPEFIEITQSMALFDSDRPNDEQMAEYVRDMWARAQYVKNDPEIQAILNDTNLRQLAKEGKVAQLLNHQGFVRLFKRVMSDDATQYIQQLQSEAKTIETTIYRWVDENGHVHYSDEEPD